MTIVPLLWLLRRDVAWRYVHGAVGLLTVILVWWFGAQYVWTPYNKLTVRPMVGKQDGTHTVGDNDDFYQAAENLSPPSVQTYPSLTNAANHYGRPYLVQGASHQDVLVVGAGTGNDVAAALRNGLRPRCAVIGV